MSKTLTTILLLMMCITTASAKGKRVLYIGDSITDGAWGNSKVWNTPSEERNHTDMNHIYGHGYMMICASYYQATFPEEQYSFFNRGISGNTLDDLKSRWQKDAIDLTPDVISILIGTNDAARYLQQKETFSAEEWEKDFRQLLCNTKAALPNVRIVLCTPFVAKVGKMKESQDYSQREHIVRQMAESVKAIARDINAILIPFDEMFDELNANAPAETYWIWDGIHPTPAAHYRMSQLWIKTVGKL